VKPINERCGSVRRVDTCLSAPVRASVPCKSCDLQACRLRDFGLLKRAYSLRDLERGDTLETHSRNCLRFWIVKQGTGATCRMFSDGRRQIVSLETTGDVVCASMADNDNEHWFEALSECKICEVNLTPWSGELRQNADFLHAIFEVMHKRLERSVNHVSTLGRLDSHERVIYFLAELALRLGARDDGNVVALPMSREDIADYLGLNSDSISRILTRLRRSGLVRFLSRTEYVVLDWSAIAQRLPISLPEPFPNAMCFPSQDEEISR